LDEHQSNGAGTIVSYQFLVVQLTYLESANFSLLAGAFSSALLTAIDSVAIPIVKGGCSSAARKRPGLGQVDNFNFRCDEAQG